MRGSAGRPGYGEAHPHARGYGAPADPRSAHGPAGHVAAGHGPWHGQHAGGGWSGAGWSGDWSGDGWGAPPHGASPHGAPPHGAPLHGAPPHGAPPPGRPVPPGHRGGRGPTHPPGRPTAAARPAPPAGGKVYAAGRRVDDEDDEEELPSPRRRGRLPRWALTLVVVGGVLMFFGGGTALAGAFLIDRYTGSIQQENLLGSAAVEPGKELEGPINILLLGLDGRKDKTDDTRSDTIIVLHIPSSHDQAYLISVPRDTWVSVPGYWEMKITEAFYHGNQDGGWTGGAQLVAQSLHQLTGLRFNAAAIVNFGGFEKIIDELGGVEYCVDTPATSEHLVLVNGKPTSIGEARRNGYAYEPIRYETGCQHLKGWQALDYVRQRKNLESGEGDYGRQRNQQQLLQAIAAQATSRDVMTNVALMDRLLRAAGDAMVIDTNGVELFDFAFTLRNLRPGDLVSLRTNDGWYNSIEVNGVSAETLNERSLAMFQAAANDTMAEFVVQNPDLVN